DPTTLVQTVLDLPEALHAERLNGLRIGLPDADQLPDFMHPAVLAAWHDSAHRLEQLGATIVPIRLPEWYFELSRPAGLIIASEAYSLHRAYIEDAAVPIGDAVRGRVCAARELAPGAYAETLRVMGERRRSFAAWFDRLDAVLLPTAAVPAPPVDEIDEASPIPGHLTRPANYLGLCALALPAGLHEGLPISVQIVGKPFAERTVLEIGKALQEDARHHALRPALRNAQLTELPRNGE
ncbi:MAG: amidase family protein, partial [Burkholderiales bacterium]